MITPVKFDERILEFRRRRKAHPVVEVTVGDQSAIIDEKLAPMIEKLWQCGINTSGCCQGDGKGAAHVSRRAARGEQAYIVFASAEDADKFAQIGLPVEARRDADCRSVYEFPQSGIGLILSRLEAHLACDPQATSDVAPAADEARRNVDALLDTWQSCKWLTGLAPIASTALSEDRLDVARRAIQHLETEINELRYGLGFAPAITNDVGAANLSRAASGDQAQGKSHQDILEEYEALLTPTILKRGGSLDDGLSNQEREES